MLELSALFCRLLLIAVAHAEVQLFVPDSSYAIVPGDKSVSELQSPPELQPTNDGLKSEDDDDDSDSLGAANPDVSAAGRSSIALSSASPAAALASASIQHHILPAETIPLPLTISTRPGLRTVIAPETITIHEPTIAKVGEVVQKIPTAVSHQSQTVVHEHARVVTPIVAPAVRTFSSQVVRAYHTPLVYAPQVPVVVQS